MVALVMKSTPRPVVEFVVLYWKDAALHGTDQIDADEARSRGLMTGISSGILVYENKEQITLAGDFFPKQGNNAKDTYRCVQSYPKSGMFRIVRKKIR